MASCDELDTLLNEIGLGRWQALSIIANFLSKSISSLHTVYHLVYFHIMRSFPP